MDGRSFKGRNKKQDLTKGDVNNTPLSRLTLLEFGDFDSYLLSSLNTVSKETEESAPKSPNKERLTKRSGNAANKFA